MANFAQRNAARESAGEAPVVADGIEIPAENIEAVQAEVESDTREITSSDSDHETLVEDMDETENAIDELDAADEAAEARANGETTDADGEELPEVEEDIDDEAVEQIAVAQEARQKRWNLTSRVTAARESYGATNRRRAVRESLWEDLKAFLKRAWEWLKEQGRKIKDRWVKFTNQGKSIQKRSKKYDAAIRKLGAKDKDEISGGFIKALTVDGKFVGEQTAELNKAMSAIGMLQDAQQGAMAEAAMAVAAAESKVPNMSAMADASRKLGTTQFLGNYVMTVKAEGTGDDSSVSVEFVESERDVETSVPTPAIAKLNDVNTSFNKLGIEIEKKAKDYHKVNQARDKYENAIEKMLGQIDKIKIDEDKELAANVRAARRIITETNSFVATVERGASHNVSCLIKGINGFLAAGIAAYKKSK